MGENDGLTAFIASFVDELTKVGVVEAVISPGSRSTPLAYTLASHPNMNVWMNVDERSAAFFALGMAKEKNKPVVLLCTSGTAAANYLPAVVEAHISRVPLIVLTADRPHELRDIGAPQVIDQLDLYGSHTKLFIEMAVPENTDRMLRFVRTTACRAAAASTQLPAGAVHLNFPLREPLIPDFELMKQYFTIDPAVIAISNGQLKAPDGQLDAIKERIKQTVKGIIVCGQIDHPAFAKAVLLLAEKTGFPVLADPLSQLRSGVVDRPVEVIDGYDSFLRSEQIAEQLAPELIIRFGAMPVSKALTLFIQQSTAGYIVVDSANGWREPTGTATEMIYCDEHYFCEKMASLLAPVSEPGAHEAGMQRDMAYLKKWQRINQIAHTELTKIKTTATFQEGQLFAHLESLLPAQSNLFIGNSLPIRDLDTYFHATSKQIRIHCNRGANGIDGVVSTALGVSAVSKWPTFLIIGDISFIHDLNSLVLAKMNQLNLFVIVLNNDGGGIFSILPQAKVESNFEQLFGTPHGLEFSKPVEMVGGIYQKASTWHEVEAAFQVCQQTTGLRVLEISSERRENAFEHREILQSIADQVASSAKSGKLRYKFASKKA